MPIRIAIQYVLLHENPRIAKNNVVCAQQLCALYMKIFLSRGFKILENNSPIHFVQLRVPPRLLGSEGTVD